jgi:hypothetical protein
MAYFLTLKEWRAGVKLRIQSDGFLGVAISALCVPSMGTL